MKSGINLAPRRTVVNKDIRIFFLISLLFFFLVFIAAVGFLLYNLTLENNLAALTQEEIQIKANTTSASTQKVNALLFKERLSSIQKILLQRKNINTSVSSVLSLVPDGASVGSFEGVTDQVSMRVTSTDLATLNLLVEERIAEFTKSSTKRLKRVEIQSFGFDIKRVQYFVSLNFLF